MKLKSQILAIFCFTFFSILTVLPLNAYSKEKVILDTDMVEAFDDGFAMLLLAKAKDIELLGVTTLSGNSWAEAGTASAIRQLELAKIKNVPVAQGLIYPFRPNRHALFQLERKFVGKGHDSWVGSFGLPKPASWLEAYKETYHENPSLQPLETHAVDFIIDTVRANPGEVTIAAIGPLGNLAMAILKAPDIVSKIKRVVYMGGSFFKPGNVTPAAEFNWYFDPEAARIVLNSKLKEQIILGLDVCEKVVFKSKHYTRFINTLKKHPMGTVLKNSFVGQSFAKNPKFTFFVWDVLVSAVIIDPSLITKSVNYYVDVNDQLGLSYGQSLAYPEIGPEGTQKATIVTDIAADRFWDLLNTKEFWKD